MKGPLVIKETNLSIAWGKAFLEVYQVGEVAPLIVLLTDLADRDSFEVPAIRNGVR